MSNEDKCKKWLQHAYGLGLHPGCKLAFVWDGHVWELVQWTGRVWGVPCATEERWVHADLDTLLSAATTMLLESIRAQGGTPMESQLSIVGVH